jgi:hypothetical protein
MTVMIEENEKKHGFPGPGAFKLDYNQQTGEKILGYSKVAEKRC